MVAKADTHTGQSTENKCGAKSHECDIDITPPSKAQGKEVGGRGRLCGPEVRRTEANSVFHTAAVLMNSQQLWSSEYEY